MPKTPTGAKRPANTFENAIRVAQIATGAAADKPSKAPGRAIGGKKGGKARATSLSAQSRREIAEKASKARWGKT